MCFETLLSVDPSIGRVDYSLMSDQTLTEMLIEGFDDEAKSKYQDCEGMYLDVCKWSLIKCDDDERVIQIKIDSRRISGSLDLCYVPPKVKVLNITSWIKSQFAGSVDLTHLPDGIEDLFLQDNRFTGEIDLQHLPEDMIHLYLQNNQFTGKIDLTHLPKGMQRLSIANNQLTGEIDLAHLPDGIKSVYLFVC